MDRLSAATWEDDFHGEIHGYMDKIGNLVLKLKMALFFW